jgi:hypothetical protein
MQLLHLLEVLMPRLGHNNNNNTSSNLLLLTWAKNQKALVDLHLLSWVDNFILVDRGHLLGNNQFLLPGQEVSFVMPWPKANQLNKQLLQEHKHLWKSM